MAFLAVFEMASAGNAHTVRQLHGETLLRSILATYTGKIRPQARSDKWGNIEIPSTKSQTNPKEKNGKTGTADGRGLATSIHEWTRGTDGWARGEKSVVRINSKYPMFRKTAGVARAWPTWSAGGGRSGPWRWVLKGD